MLKECQVICGFMLMLVWLFCKNERLHKTKILYDFSTKIYNSGKKVEKNIKISYNDSNGETIK